MAQVIPKAADVYSWPRTLGVLTVWLGLMLALSSLALPQARRSISARYQSKAEWALGYWQLDTAESALHHAMAWNASNQVAADLLTMVSQLPTDPAVGKDYYQARAAQYPALAQRLDLLQQAQADFATPKDALIKGVALLQAQEYAMARYPLEQAVTQDPGYTEAWDYLAQTYTLLAGLNTRYREKATAAIAQRDHFSTKWREQPTTGPDVGG